MTKTLIYLIAIFALWLYFRYGNFGKGEEKRSKEEVIEDADKAGSGSGGTMASAGFAQGRV